jgi:hypothetical protein
MMAYWPARTKAAAKVDRFTLDHLISILGSLDQEVEGSVSFRVRDRHSQQTRQQVGLSHAIGQLTLFAFADVFELVGQLFDVEFGKPAGAGSCDNRITSRNPP